MDDRRHDRDHAAEGSATPGSRARRPDRAAPSPSHGALLALLLACAAGLAAGSAAADPAGEELANRVYNRPTGKDLAARALMALQQPGQPERVRRLYSYARQTDRNGQKNNWGMLRFVAPADIEDTALLSISLAAGQEDQWIYLPALKKSRRIPSNRRGGRFVGSDFYYEDLQDRKPEEFEHRILGKEDLQGTPTTVLESVPKDASDSVYKRIVSWIHEGIQLPVRTDYYEESVDKPSKRFQMYRVQQVQGYWTVMDSVMIDLRTNHQTRLVSEVVKYDQGIPEEFFSVRTLESPGSAETKYRP